MDLRHYRTTGTIRFTENRSDRLLFQVGGKTVFLLFVVGSLAFPSIEALRFGLWFSFLLMLIEFLFLDWRYIKEISFTQYGIEVVRVGGKKENHEWREIDRIRTRSIRLGRFIQMSISPWLNVDYSDLSLIRFIQKMNDYLQRGDDVPALLRSNVLCRGCGDFTPIHPEQCERCGTRLSRSLNPDIRDAMIYNLNK